MVDYFYAWTGLSLALQAVLLLFSFSAVYLLCKLQEKKNLLILFFYTIAIPQIALRCS